MAKEVKETISIEKLKAQAYDVISQIQFWQNKLAELNNKILAEMKKDNDGRTGKIPDDMPSGV